MIDWPVVADLVPEGKSGNVEIRHVLVDKQASDFTKLRSAINPGRDEYVPEGKYAHLYVGGAMMMSDTDMEKRSNQSAIIHATGHVLVAGLGLGMIIHPIAKKPEVKRITIVEKSPDVIKLVAASLPKKAEVIHGDIFEWSPPKGMKYDTIYFDIWPGICTDNLEGMAKLHRRFGRYKSSPEAWMESWQRQRLLGARRRERNDPWRGMVRCGYGR